MYETCTETTGLPSRPLVRLMDISIFPCLGGKGLVYLYLQLQLKSHADIKNLCYSYVIPVHHI